MSLRCGRAVDVRCLENRSCSGPQEHVVSATLLTANQAGNDGNTAIEPYDAWGIAARKRVPISLPNAEVSQFRYQASTRSMKESIFQTAESSCRWLPCMRLDETPTLEHSGTGCGGRASRHGLLVFDIPLPDLQSAQPGHCSQLASPVWRMDKQRSEPILEWQFH
jgi:hypothetical protein